ncbi:2-hydroxyacid dehydrogenase [Nonomuraea sp. NPDC004702]
MSYVGKILVTGESIGATYLERLTQAGFEVINPSASYPPSILDEADLQAALAGCTAYIVGGDEWASKTAMQAAPDLKVVSFLGVGYQSFVDAEGARELNIPVTNTPGTYANSVAEFTIGMLLDRRRRIFDYAESRRLGTGMAQEKRFDVFGHPIGILGMGHIGSRIATILTQGLNADVYYHNRTRKPQLENELNLKYRDLKQLIAEVETLIVIIPEDPSTIGMIDDEIFEVRSPTRPGLQVIDTARPEVIDPASLIRALESGRVENVAFDGFYRDSTPETQALAKDRRVLVTPHIASLTHDARDAMSQMAIDTVLRILRGGTDATIVNGVVPSTSGQSNA